MATTTHTHATERIQNTEIAGLLDELIETTRKHQQPALSVQDKLTLAEAMGKARVFPGIENQYQAMAAIEIGQALGMAPGEALMAIHFGAQGKPAISVHWQAAKLQQLGWRWTFLEHTSATCRMRFFPPANHPADPFEYQFTMAQAKDIRVYDKEQGGKGGSLAGKWNYQSWGEDMLYAYCLRRVVRRYEPRVLGGFTPDDEGDESTVRAGAPVDAAKMPDTIADVWGDAPASPSPHPETPQNRLTPVDETHDTSDEAPSDSEATEDAEPTLTPKQAEALTHIEAQCARLGISPGEALGAYNQAAETAYGLWVEVPVPDMRQVYGWLKARGQSVREALRGSRPLEPLTVTPDATPASKPAAGDELF